MRQENDRDRLRAWLIEDTGSDEEADRLLPIIERLSNLSDMAVYPAMQTDLTDLLIQEYREGKSANVRQRTVVCIDDDESMINLVGNFLKKKGFDVLGAMSGSDALELVPKVRPDVVLLDLMMPDMDGWDVYQHMKADEYMRTLPVIIVSAKAQTIDKVLGLNIAKVQDYLTKPFSPSELVSSIDRVLSEANGHR